MRMCGQLRSSTWATTTGILPVDVGRFGKEARGKRMGFERLGRDCWVQTGRLFWMLRALLRGVQCRQKLYAEAHRSVQAFQRVSADYVAGQQR
mmetsp:Transcript_43756/g.89378  ORF Transcript_43756/g.89378 Transcript_43756/m.89378 type:complete len:93 (+) Transcript_43756:93-371(+)